MSTNIPAPRVPFLDPRTGDISREWYLFLLALFQTTGVGGGDGDGDFVARTGDEMSGPLAIDAESSGAAFSVNQSGAGNVATFADILVGESTPTIIDGAGRFIRGWTEAIEFAASVTPASQVLGVNVNVGQAILRASNNTGGSYNLLAKARGTLAAGFDVVEEGDELGDVGWEGHDGTVFRRAANIYAVVDGAPNSGDMPGKIVFATTRQNDNSPTDWAYLDSYGVFGVTTLDATDDILINGSPIPISLSRTFMMMGA